MLIKGGHVVLSGDVILADILISQGRIQAVLEPGLTAIDTWEVAGDVFDATGLLIFPGVIDTHVHFSTSTAHMDTLQDVTRAAALGGTTTIVGYVRSTEGNIVSEIARQRDLTSACPIDVAFHAILTPQDDPERDVPALIEQGVRSFKLFMAYRKGGTGMDDQRLFETLKIVAKQGGMALVHAEDEDVIAATEAALVAAGRTHITDYPASRPVHTEVEAIRRALWLADLVSCPLYIVHVSTCEGLALITREKQRRLLDAATRRPVYAESCPKYLTLNETAYQTLGNIAKVAPPLRSAEEQQALHRAFLSGAIDAMGSDHSPHALERKQGASFLDVRASAPGAQTFFPVMLSQVLEESGDTNNIDALGSLQRTLSQRPAKIFDLYPQKGRIGPGADADLVFVDLEVTWEVTGDWLVSNSGFSLYEGRQLHGKPVHSMVRGRWVMRDGQLTCESGGQYLDR